MNPENIAGVFTLHEQLSSPSNPENIAGVFTLHEQLSSPSPPPPPIKTAETVPRSAPGTVLRRANAI
ncbi:hypothetical protein QE152_g303 [Popillia japonica]|uniref:Uncharacterized protein n=1 Tax=Popillia japonica TaxID=7064 RepID=A0AAW1NKQ5_POPJA